MAKNKLDTIKVKEKEIVILRFDSGFPVGEADLLKMMKTIREAINKDSTIAERFICLAKGIDIETMAEEDFVRIWTNKWGKNSYEMAQEELERQEQELEDDFDDEYPDEINNIEDVLQLNRKDEDGNTWKPLSDEDYEKAKRGEL